MNSFIHELPEVPDNIDQEAPSYVDGDSGNWLRRLGDIIPSFGDRDPKNWLRRHGAVITSLAAFGTLAGETMTHPAEAISSQSRIEAPIPKVAAKELIQEQMAEGKLAVNILNMGLSFSTKETSQGAESYFFYVPITKELEKKYGLAKLPGYKINTIQNGHETTYWYGTYPGAVMVNKDPYLVMVEMDMHNPLAEGGPAHDTQNMVFMRVGNLPKTLKLYSIRQNMPNTGMGNTLSARGIVDDNGNIYPKGFKQRNILGENLHHTYSKNEIDSLSRPGSFFGPPKIRISDLKNPDLFK